MAETIQLLQPYRAQYDILQDKSRFKVVILGRRSGKTELGKIAIANVILKNGGTAFWVAPSFRESLDVWRSLKETFSPMIRWKSEQSHTLELVNGGQLSVYSGEAAERMRGTSPDLIIMDEAAMISDQNMWYSVARPALTDKKGKAYFLSTPKGRNWLYDIFLLGNNPNNNEYKSWQFPTWKNPFIPKSEILEAKNTLPEKLFRQEYLAEFLVDAGEVFVGVSAVCVSPYRDPYRGRFSMGVDLARKNDFTVVSIFDMDKKEMVFMDRFNQISWTAQRDRILEIYGQWNPTICTIEQNNVGDVIIEDLRRNGMSINPFITSNASKRKLIEGMAVAIQNKEVKLLNDQDLIFEFQSMLMHVNTSGTVSYSAPLNRHDDIVIATCLSYYGMSSNNLVYGLPFPKISGWASR